MFALVFLYLISASLTVVKCELRSDNLFWKNLAKDELEEALKVKWNQNVAKNVILFIGDGMGPNTVTATRIYKGGESNRLVYEQFPHVGLLKTYSANKMVPDSACTATALLCGVKTNQETVGVDASVKFRDCQSSLMPSARLSSLAALALKAGKNTGFVTTMRVTHATPGPMYAHSADRKWESDSVMPDNAKDCKDIGRQLVEDWPGRDFHVIMGGGKQTLAPNVTETVDDPIDSWASVRKDGRDLINYYKRDKEARKLKYAVVFNNKDLEKLNSNETDYVLGIFANGHLRYEHDRNKGPLGMPSISDMVKAAINILKKNSKGYFLMVEGGNIDFAHHRGRAKVAINEAAAMEDAVRIAVDMTSEEDTLLIVTSDHTHTLSINGYPYRGTNIFGIAPQAPDGSNYTTLTYGTGGPTSYHYYVKENPDGTDKVVRKDPSLVDTNSFDYHQLAAIKLAENSHGGGDVAVYARGPFSHLFHNVHEQHYVYHAISYAAKLGDYSANHAESMLLQKYTTLLTMAASIFTYLCATWLMSSIDLIRINY